MPYDEDSYYKQVELINRKNYDPSELPSEYSNELKSIIGSMFTKDPVLRPTCSHLLGNKYIILHLSRKLARLSNVQNNENRF